MRRNPVSLDALSSYAERLAVFERLTGCREHAPYVLVHAEDTLVCHAVIELQCAGVPNAVSQNPVDRRGIHVQWVILLGSQDIRPGNIVRANIRIQRTSDRENRTDGIQNPLVDGNIRRLQIRRSNTEGTTLVQNTECMLVKLLGEQDN